MEFRQLRSYVALVECENFTVAAQKLGVSQPTISTHLRILETELQTQLVLRGTRRVCLTARGHEFFEFAKRVVNLEDALKDKWLKENGHLHIGASTVPSTYILPKLMPEYLNAHPEVQFKASQGDSTTILDNLRSGLFDLGVVGEAIDDEVLSFTPFASERMMLIAPNEHRFAVLGNRRTLDVETLRNILRRERIIVREEGSASGHMASKVLETLELTPEDYTVAAVVANQETIINMVYAGVGVAIVSSLAAEDALRFKNLLAFELPFDTVRKFYLATFRYANLSPTTQEFKDYLEKSSDKFSL